MKMQKSLVFVLTFFSTFYRDVISEDVLDCGGTYSGYQYTINSPGYPEKYSSDLKCIYTLTGNKLLKCEPNFYLQFLDFDITESEYCKDEFLQVGDEHIYCGNLKKFKKFIGKNGTLKVIFHTTNKKSTHRGFKILVTADCATSYEINSRENRSKLFTTAESENNSSKAFSTHRTQLNQETEKKDVYFFLPPNERNYSTLIKFPSDEREQKNSSTGLSQRNLELENQDRLVQVFDPNREASIDSKQTINRKLNADIYSTVAGQSGLYPSNSYYPNNQNYPNYNSNPYNPFPNNFVPVNPYPGYGFSSIDGVNNNYPFPSGSECCQTVYSAPRFLISSPGFPNIGYSTNSLNCGYTIRKSSPQICNLRLNFKFFNFGSEDPYCNNGYLEIEGQKLCGCRTGSNIVIPFLYEATRLNVRSIGIQQSKFSGFLIEIIQENCNYNYNYNYRYKRELSNSDRNGKIKRQSGYSYPVPNTEVYNNNFYNQVYPGNVGRFNYGNCQSRIFFDWVLASKEVFLRNSRCHYNIAYARNNVPFAKLVTSDKNDKIKTDEIDDCEIILSKTGMLSSPTYPAEYANNTHKCYRFQKLDGSCRLDLSIVDFDLEHSQNCEKDFIQFSQQSRRYCDQTLIGKKLSLDLSTVNDISMTFNSDGDKNGRGFLMAYEQIECK